MNAVKNVVDDSAAMKMAANLIEKADIQINGTRPWDIQLKARGVADRLFAKGSLGLGESYMDGDWEVEQLDEFFTRVLRARLDQQLKPARLVLHGLRAKIMNLQTSRRAWQVGEQHYDLGNEFYEAMLDPRMTYTCGYWKDATTLVEAQEAKLDLVCRKLGLKPGMRLLDIGCGWGSLMSFAAQNYGVECVGITISKEQAAWAQQRYAGLPMEFRLQDYREVQGQFDRIASIGMFEHVGRKNHRIFLEVANRCLKDDGLFLLHTIGKNICHTPPDPWVDKYIFPNGDLPSISQISSAASNLFVIEDLHNFGADYDTTLMAWFKNFEASWPKFSAQLGERFYRMWKYYLLSCAGAFRARDIQLWQFVMAKSGVVNGYTRVS
ncbi:MAG: cyclopropane fatty acyl phospholipid synthase [Marinospirillum sp.]|uniref:cyclopropane fatty acyl phospholipid synthase n=1 Tax=Marinospirillum sp. TaxID=2183934 RepID=UPI001A092FCD|nr:cyclopropane fatty acyl phospholipid synthase [Marinospirillum sp.]MBE0508557.1 cyclopropane fatty acyl phospholipid synthase [Marinospirillum sp.]